MSDVREGVLASQAAAAGGAVLVPDVRTDAGAGAVFDAAQCLDWAIESLGSRSGFNESAVVSPFFEGKRLKKVIGGWRASSRFARR